MSVGRLTVELSWHHIKALAELMYFYFTSEINELNAASWSLVGDKTPNMLQQDDTELPDVIITCQGTSFDFLNRDPLWSCIVKERPS